jgi:hypothetical protein
MGLHVFDDDRPGYALLAFGDALSQPTLSVSIRSLRENAFLGPNGKWQKEPFFFPAVRVGAEGGCTQFRVGPEIVNFLLEHDRIEVASDDGSLKEEALWENAVPELPGQRSLNTVYRTAAPVPPSEPAGPQQAVKPAITDRHGGAETATPPSPPPAPPDSPSRKLWWIAGLVGLLAIAAGGIGLSPLGCKLFGVSCPNPGPNREGSHVVVPPPSSEPDLLARALACASDRHAAAPCEIAACFSRYRSETPDDRLAPEARKALLEGEAACQSVRQAAEERRRSEERAAEARRSEERALQSAQQCAAQAAPCVVKDCYAGYLTEYGGSGALREQARSAVARAAEQCRSSPSSPGSAIADGAYNAVARRACGASQQYGIRVVIAAGRISWDHDFRGIRFAWTGTIDAQGQIRAAVGGSRDMTAGGRFTDNEREVEMRYPPCPEAIPLSILGRL